MSFIELNKDQWQQLKPLLTSALKLGASERLALFERELSDEALRAYGLHLLQYYDRASKPLASVADGSTKVPNESRERSLLSIAPGEFVGPYRVVRKLGEGGMGVVYLAEDERLGRRVALKFLSPALSRSDEDSRNQLMAESRSAALLNHPGIVTLHDVCEMGGKLVAVMEYVEGRPLSDLIHEGPQPLGFALRLSKQLADALAYAHGRGIVHCDLKPANIHVLPSGAPKILDFGLARSLNTQRLAVESEDRPLFGTPGYVAPERLLGREATAPADVYALGVVLYQLLTGMPPFPAEDHAQLFLDTLTATPLAPSRLVASIPAAVDEFTFRCLSKNPRDRLQPFELSRIIDDALHSLESETFAQTSLMITRGPEIENPGAGVDAGHSRPRQHYVITDDGVRITYAVHGSGPPLIFVRGWMSHLDLMWDDQLFRQFMETLGRRFTVVRYDARGNGLSERNVKAIDLNALVRDLEALVDQLEFKRVIVYGSTFGGLVATVYAARHPDRVESLILEGAYARGAKITTKPRKLFLLNAFRVFPEAAFLLLSYATNPGGENSSPRRLEWMQQMITGSVAAKLYSLALNADISSHAAAIQARTLVMHRRESHSIPVTLGKELSALIPNSTFVALPGHAHNLWEGDPTAALEQIERFLNVDLGLSPALVKRSKNDHSDNDSEERS